jgi:hypothetical protein
MGEYLYDENRDLISLTSYKKTYVNDNENLIVDGKTTYEYNPDNYLTKYISLILKDEVLINREMILYDRDEYNNITKIRNDYWHNNEWKSESETRIIYKKKEY